MQGRPVGIHSCIGRIVLRWQKDKDAKVMVSFKCREAIPAFGKVNTIRCVQLTEDGLDVVDAVAVSFLARSARVSLKMRAF